MFVIERIAPGLARFRLAGMGISAILGMDVRGMPLSSVFDAKGRDRLSPALESVFRDTVALDLWLEAERGLGRPALTGRMAVLPLVSTRGLTDLALGCLALDGEVGRSPRRFDITALLSETLQVTRPPERQAITPPTARPTAPQPARELAPGFAEIATPYQPPRPPRGKPQLRLVKSDD